MPCSTRTPHPRADLQPHAGLAVISLAKGEDAVNEASYVRAVGTNR